MNQITEDLVATYSPKLAVVVYSTSDENGKYYLESHDIDDKGRILAGKPLQQQTLQAVVDVFFTDNLRRQAIEGVIPENLLHFSALPGGEYKMAWYRPAQVRPVHFVEKLKIPSGSANMPPLVFVADRGDLAVYAFTGTDRPAENTMMYRAPFYNVNADGDVCLGNSKVKLPEKKTYTNMMVYWETLFYNSEFSHINGSNPTKSPLSNIWKSLVRNKKSLFPLDELIEYKTLKSIL